MRALSKVNKAIMYIIYRFGLMLKSFKDLAFSEHVDSLFSSSAVSNIANFMFIYFSEKISCANLFKKN